ncbi:similar to Saccharomyces cerevisiae YJR101W RSM26 Mitochondrial ribosomal protein of the small subunit [Maudiozyma saulgeensis]|uniref:Similar to Saccharomyces cerevisiae YJR101W RSM26 Mitochondrial ribosomal protein of the small subunit n=1 Tax=Maudiozyma saulgeensis TaxID=1789683 RepID=A0A1X7R632_9SACH|nr:similar to Saccharomyces cerevisiae YJR101W RSM26 Mitochondrial ribosomal protein of the small subunit [Kazachstania saulgeensis]
MLSRTLGRRSIHTVPKLTNIKELSKSGIPKIYSANGFNTVWSDYQKYLCDKLTLATAGSTLESYYPFHIMLNTAKKSYQSNIFNLASAIHNNHLFIENIMPVKENESNQPSKLLLSRIQESFDLEWEELKTDIVKLIDKKIVGQGWFFLIENSNKEIHYLFLQNNGTPYYFPRNQLFDLNVPINLNEFTHLEKMKDLLKGQGKTKIKDWSMPLICINLWDQAYLSDYGVGKRSEYVKNILDNLNWNVVNNRLYK